MIVTLAGVSGAGKSTIGEWLRKRFGSDLKPVVSFTTREQRDTDPPGEYAYIALEVFEVVRGAGKFIWSVFISGNWYGTMFGSLEKTKLEPNAVFLMILEPDSVGTLHIHAKKMGLKVLSFYLVSPPVEDLHCRLEKRAKQEREKKMAKMRANGMSESEIWAWLKSQTVKDGAVLEGRIQDCLKWDERALESKIPYVFVRNDLDDNGQVAAATIATEIIERLSV